MHKKIKRIFHNLKITDYLFFLVVLASLFYAAFSFNKKETEVFIELTFNRNDWSKESIPPENWRVNDIKTGDVVYTSLGKKVAVVEEVNRQVWQGGVRESIYLIIKIKTLFDKKSQKYLYNGAPLLLGEKLSLDIGNTKFEGQIMNIFSSKENRYQNFESKTAKVKILCSEYQPWHANLLRNFEVIQPDGKLLLKVTSSDVRPAELIIPTDDGRLVKAIHPVKKDVILDLYLPEVMCSDQGCFYNHTQPLLVGYELWADSGETWFGHNSSIIEVEVFDN